jgi:hypothetical protein
VIPGLATFPVRFGVLSRVSYTGAKIFLRRSAQGECGESRARPIFRNGRNFSYGIFTIQIVVIDNRRFCVMPKAEEVNGTDPTSPVELAPQEIDAMMAEAVAVDALLQRMRPGSFDFALAISAYLSSPGASAKPKSDEDRSSG